MRISRLTVLVALVAAGLLVVPLSASAQSGRVLEATENFDYTDNLRPIGFSSRNVPLDTVRQQLTDQIQEGKLRDEASKLFEELQKAAHPQNVWNNPQLREQYPGVVALINTEQIRYEELAEECLLRYGEQVLDVEI